MTYRVGGVEIPDPFAAALCAGRPGEVRALPAESGPALFGRALAHAATGHDVEARADFAAAAAECGDACAIELALLDLRDHRQTKAARDVAKAIAERSAAQPLLAARAWHVVGLAENRLRDTPAAVDALLKALDGYQTAGEALGRAQVRDTLGLVEAARGRLDFALECFALSLVDKSLLGDRPGMAITLGNLGRLNVRSGRFRDAVECFERDLALCRQLGDARGEVRMHLDLGRSYAGLDDLPHAEERLFAARTLAVEKSYRDLELLARIELARIALARQQTGAAASELAAAAHCLGREPESYQQITYDLARGELLAAQGDAHALDVLETAVRQAAAGELPDLEIAGRLALARALMAARYKATAEQCLLAGLKLARREGYARYLPLLNEEMTRLDLVEGAVEETPRPMADASTAHAQAYVVRARLGGGAFGEVFRVYDPVRGTDVALKKLRLAQLYDVRERRNMLTSARRELEAASRIRHPGVVRVLAVGAGEEGDVYVVQELVEGSSLRKFMPESPTADVGEVLRGVAQIAHSLAALHEASVIHRDLKPENVLVRSSGQPVLVDFGIAHLARAPDNNDHALLGTLPYMAPEQAQGKRIDARADLYALGVLLFEWLAGVRPLRLRGATVEEQVRDLVQRPAPKLSELRPGVDAELEQLVAALLAKNPRQRPASAVAVAEACAALIK